MNQKYTNDSGLMKILDGLSIAYKNGIRVIPDYKCRFIKDTVIDGKKYLRNQVVSLKGCDGEKVRMNYNGDTEFYLTVQEFFECIKEDTPFDRGNIYKISNNEFLDFIDTLENQGLVYSEEFKDKYEYKDGVIRFPKGTKFKFISPGIGYDCFTVDGEKVEVVLDSDLYCDLLKQAV